MAKGSKNGGNQWKVRGEWVELRFMAKAAELGFRVIKPWGDCSRYDFAVESGGRFHRIQVKATSSWRGTHYVCALSRASNQRYEDGEVDFFAVYIVPLEVWYIIPFEAVKNMKRGVTLAPHNSITKQAAFKEAWHLLQAEGAVDETATSLAGRR